MKITIEVDMDIPDGEFHDHSDPELHQAIFDGFVNFAQVQHLTQALKWMEEDSNEDSPYGDCKDLVQRHRNWAGMLNKSTFTIKRGEGLLS